MKTYLFAFVLCFSFQPLGAQELGYIGGANNLGYNSGGFQMLYGLSLGKRFTDYFTLESGCFFSQRQYENSIQADYLTFFAMPQFGVFKDKIGIYAGPTLALNPTLHHSINENHTYASAGLGVGGRLLLFKKVWGDLRFCYDKGLTGAYFMNGSYKNYDGLAVFAGLKFDLSCK